ncbi:MAG: flagellar motor protein MotB [Planctomycetaceae bacterium]
MAGKGGGAWKVAYADFATAMMAFFLVMWITSQNKAVKESVAQYFENPLGTVSEARASSVHGIPGASADAALVGEQAGPHGSSTREQGTYAQSGNSDTHVEGARPPIHIFDRLDKSRSLGTMVLFKAESTELAPEAQRQLSEFAIEVRGKSNKVEVRGHAIQRRNNNGAGDRDAWTISSERAVNTMKFLISCGIEPQRFRLSQDGSYEPYSNQGNKLEDPRNDRVEVWAIDELTHGLKPTINRRAGNFVPATAEHAPAPPPAAKEKEHAAPKKHGHGH